MNDTERPRGALERALSPLADVRGGEGLGVVLLALNAFLLLTAYYLIKPVREALILGGAGAEVKSYSSAGQALLLLFLVPAYGIERERGFGFLLEAVRQARLLQRAGALHLHAARQRERVMRRIVLTGPLSPSRPGP